MITRSQSYTDGGKGWMSCISGGIFVGCLGGSDVKVDLNGVAKKKRAILRFCIESEAWGVSLCFRYLYIKAIL